jgi:hypothetical protein
MPPISGPDDGTGWNPERFAREQIRRLVRQVFFSGGLIEVRQVVLSAMDEETDVHPICARIGEALAEETASDVAVVGAVDVSGIQRASSAMTGTCNGEAPENPCRGGRHPNLWLLPAQEGLGSGSKLSMKTYLDDIRREFQYSVVQAPAVANCDQALSLAELADGLILVLSAKRSRRVAAFRIRQMLALAQVRLLGTVLSDREFPIPEKLYRHL